MSGTAPSVWPGLYSALSPSPRTKAQPEIRGPLACRADQVRNCRTEGRVTTRQRFSTRACKWVPDLRFAASGMAAGLVSWFCHMLTSFSELNQSGDPPLRIPGGSAAEIREPLHRKVSLALTPSNSLVPDQARDGVWCVDWAVLRLAASGMTAGLVSWFCHMLTSFSELNRSGDPPLRLPGGSGAEIREPSHRKVSFALTPSNSLVPDQTRDGVWWVDWAMLRFGALGTIAPGVASQKIRLYTIAHNYCRTQNEALPWRRSR